MRGYADTSADQKGVCPWCGWRSHERYGLREYWHSWIVHTTHFCNVMEKLRPLAAWEIELLNASKPPFEPTHLPNLAPIEFED